MGCAMLFALTGAGTGWAGNFPLFVSFRMLSGVAVGAAALVCPMYVAEISPAPMRGRMVSFYQLSIVTGILLAYLSNYLLLNTGVNNWRWMFSSQSVPSLLFFLGLFFVAESPRWLIGKHRHDEAEAILKRIGGPTMRWRRPLRSRPVFRRKLEPHRLAASRSANCFGKNCGQSSLLVLSSPFSRRLWGRTPCFPTLPNCSDRRVWRRIRLSCSRLLLGLSTSFSPLLPLARLIKSGEKSFCNTAQYCSV